MSNSFEKEEFKFEVDINQIMIKVRLFIIIIIKDFKLAIFFRKILIKKMSLNI